MTGSHLIGGLTPCNVIPDEILTDHPKRFRAMLVESGNPAHSVADSARMREAFASLDLLVVIDVAFTETARLAHYVLPVASQFEKAEATFFNFEFPENYFHVRKRLMPPLSGLFSEAELHCRLLEALGELPAEPIATLRAAWKEGRKSFGAKFVALAKSDPRVFPLAPALLYRAMGDLLPEGGGGRRLVATVPKGSPNPTSFSGPSRLHGRAGRGRRCAVRCDSGREKRCGIRGRHLG